MNLKNKIILITGGSSGIGKAAALQLVQSGAIIVLQARSVAKLKEVAAELTKKGATAHYYSTNLTSATAVQETASKIINEVGLPDIVVNSAGAGEWLSLKEASIEHYQETMASPYLATAYTCKAFYDKMLVRGSGHFIIINSAACFFAFPGATGYTAARWAMLGFAKSLQADLHGSNIDVSMIAFGKVDSPYFTNNPVSEERIPKIVNFIMPTMTTEESGKIILNTIHRRANIVIKPVMMAICVWFNKFIPGFISWLMRIS